MKKILVLFFIVFLYSISTNKVYAEHYQNYEELNLTRGKVLDDYTDEELKTYYKDVKKSKFSGWKTKFINKNVKATFISETIFSYYNDGYTPIDYIYKMEEKSENKYSFSATGSISVSKSSSKAGFKSGLDGSLKLSYTSSEQIERKEAVELKVKVDPGTQVNLYIYGEGKISNGVAAKYLFWIRSKLGGFEVFEVTTEYQKLEKVRI
ncbi:MAG: hypothetical protein RBQ97_02975 [Acholeplasma sp.]|nr:hypothetical protein [Acholeplasma sp.]